ncbi:MAG: hypothetical protein JXR87_00425 [Candidatus Marinimicrobia bacterium]|nr:hypothetical protein [Candidatus Neomarinimicrobiota bacterium]
MKKLILFWLVLSVTINANDAIHTKFPIDLYGFVRMEASYDNTEVVKGDWLLYAQPGNTAYADQSIFTMNVRHSRLGIKISGPAIGQNGTVSGLIEVDFAGGFPNSSTAARQPQLRLRHAWVEINKPGWELRFGQDWALISGPFPNTTSFVVGAGKGNLWMRYPQMKYTLKKDVLKLAISVNRPMAGNIKYEDIAGGDFDPVGDGERSGLPWLMGRVWIDIGKKSVSLSGHYGQEQIADLAGLGHAKTSYSINVDFVLETGPITWTVRGFTGENLNSFFGGVFQGYSSNGSSVTNVPSKGGWGQAVYTLNDYWSFTLGSGLDDPDDNVLSGNARTKNTWFFGNVALNYSNSLIFMLEAEYLKTGYLSAKDGENLRLQFVTYLKF